MGGLLLFVVGGAGCRDKDKDATPGAPAGSPGAVAPGGAAPERAWNGIWTDDGKGRAAEWRPKEGQTLQVYALRDEGGQGVVRVQAGEARQDVERFAYRPGVTPEVAVRTLPGDRLVLRYGPVADREARRTRVVALLGWDEAAQKAKVLRRWRGADGQREPSWARSGVLGLEPAASEHCERVVRRIAACAPEAGFKDVLFRRMNGDARGGLERDFSADVGRWKEARAAGAQCARWAGEGYEESAFSDPAELAELARETELDCAMFGREIDDEGGLPRPVGLATFAGR